MPNRQNQTGRSKHKSPFVRLDQYLLNSGAWLSLTPAARAVYVEIRRVYNGTNNGTLGLSVRTAAGRCRIAKDTAARAFAQLEDRGFIRCVVKGAFSWKQRRATEWQLTDETCNVTGALATKDFMQWSKEKQNTVPIQTVAVADEGPPPLAEFQKAA